MQTEELYGSGQLLHSLAKTLATSFITPTNEYCPFKNRLSLVTSSSTDNVQFQSSKSGCMKFPRCVVLDTEEWRCPGCCTMVLFMRHYGSIYVSKKGFIMRRKNPFGTKVFL